ncbi:MAG: hypothetical protein ABL931_13540, partial [Usitatibacteraceae bacterium]
MRLPADLRFARSQLLAFFLAAFLSTLAPLASAQPSPVGSVPEGVAPEAMAQIGALLADKETRTKAQQKLDSQLLYGARMAALREAAPGVPAQEVNLRYVEGASAVAGTKLVLVDIRVAANSNATVVAAIELLGGQINTNVPQFNAIRAAVPLDQLESLAGLAEVRFVAPASVMENDTGSVNSEGDRTLGTDTARLALQLPTGNVKVCVLSDSASATGLANSVASGNLSPGQVTVLPGQAGTGADEGVAMLEIINDLAPGAQLFFSTANGGEAAFAQNILSLRSTYNCDVMVDDIRYATEVPFQDAVIARAVNTVTAGGALYFASAGNSGNKSDGTSGTWVGDFVNGGAFVVPGVATAYEVHSFQTAPSVQNFNVVNSGGSSYALSLFWSDPENGSANDYDVFQLNAAGTAVVSSSTNVQNGTQNAFESTTLATG